MHLSRSFGALCSLSFTFACLRLCLACVSFSFCRGVRAAVGTDLTWAHEEHDATSIAFTDAQAQLIKQVADAAKKPVIGEAVWQCGSVAIE